MIDRFLLVTDALAQAHDARIRVLTAMGPDGSDDEAGTAQAFHDRLVEHCNSPTFREIIRPENVVSGLVTATGNADLAIVGTMARSRLRDFFSTNRTTALLAAGGPALRRAPGASPAAPREHPIPPPRRTGHLLGSNKGCCNGARLVQSFPDRRVS